MYYNWDYKGEYLAESEYSALQFVGGFSSAEVKSALSVDLRRNGLNQRKVVSRKSLRSDLGLPLKSVSSASGNSSLSTLINKGDIIETSLEMRGDIRTETVPFSTARGYMDFNDSGKVWWVRGGPKVRIDFYMKPGYAISC